MDKLEGILKILVVCFFLSGCHKLGIADENKNDIVDCEHLASGRHVEYWAGALDTKVYMTAGGPTLSAIDRRTGRQFAIANGGDGWACKKIGEVGKSTPTRQGEKLYG